MTQSTNQELANLLFPYVTKTVEDYEKEYPIRPEWVTVTRIAPSPTGFLHMWSLYNALVAERFAHQSHKNGVFFLRIEDTDQKREVPWAVQQLIDGLRIFGIQPDEGPIGKNNTDVWNYWPYTQSHRKEIYQAFVKELVAKGKAYPCWMSQKEIDDTRAMQEAAKKIPWIYGPYAKWRDADFSKQKEMIDAWEPFVVRLYAPNTPEDMIIVKDLIKWEVRTQANFLDHVLLKSTDGLPTYHMAHLVDDHLMRTTHVIRWDEWFASLPLHVQLFEVFGFQPPEYAHIAPLMKVDEITNNKRKLSKRHDHEANVQRFLEQGIPPKAVLEFLMNIIDPFFEDWQKNNMDKTYLDYTFDIARMGASGALFDMTKLLFVSKEQLAKIDKESFYDMALAWAENYAGTIGNILEKKYNPTDGDITENQRRMFAWEAIFEKQLSELMKEEKKYTFDALNIERLTDTDPKRYQKLSDIIEQLPVFYDQVWDEMRKIAPALPEACNGDHMRDFLHAYVEKLDLDLSKEAWFEQLKQIGKEHGYATSNAEYKEGGYVWKTGDLAMFLRIKLLCSTKTPDLYESMRVMGKERVLLRIQKI